ncbi:AsnC family transcriptional regulator [Pseudoclavibacter sp. AY1F1]|uniref:Lrp/AsnC family transcriptional regulator n=1 Tax=Pseudoclavibacter sp. AY1F1 TaxID=2080583 RepID=UPI000CE93414|nr:Lrp/AsnC family transcriptional regulator [Pseudoclavibacter sp. AY1F1]PPF44797.1 AsnC family transcriptional regulator [Pseudoclavibacter sp. AY1F1]
MDQLDLALIELLDAHPGLPVVEYARRLSVARATVQSRLDRLHSRGVIESMSPRISLVALGYPVLAVCTIQIRQSSTHALVYESLQAIPELLELHTITGEDDMMAKFAARSTDDLQRVFDAISTIPAISRTKTSIAMKSYVNDRTRPLLRKIVQGGDR